MSTSDTQKIRELLTTYEHSLNTSDAALAASCYTSDGVFMPTTLPTSSGADLETAYAGIFEMIALDIKFTFDEIVVAEGGYAFALTSSSGTQTVLAPGVTNSESNREIFILRVEDGDWKIARYMFNKSE
ncbi:MAG: SgcJ/EcaC family oxidoreductase [Actinobacteria bacterium]|nr:SgcJ/EcaC family oxidoreductase [Actinomycetota bacterium]